MVGGSKCGVSLSLAPPRALSPRERGRERASARKTDRQAGRKEWMQRRGCDTRMVRQAEPKLAKYFESDAYKLPVNNPGATPYFF